MSTTDDPFPSDDQPPPIDLSREMKPIIGKLSNKYELKDYIHHIAAFHTQHLTDEAELLRNQLLLQGLDDEDLYKIHKFLNITFDGELMKMLDKKLTMQRANLLDELLDD